MSVIGFCGIVGASIFRRHRQFAARPLPTVCFTSRILRFHRHCSSAAASDCDHAIPVSSENPVNSRHHPWAEWVSFIDCLKTKGYLNESAAASSLEDTASEGNGNEFGYTDKNILKNACISFSRDRFDILNLLPTQDILAVVEKGCPNLFRKAVNSAKRLRLYLQHDERHACEACNLRGSCDRAYVILNEAEGEARTVDIVRLLLLYALDPLVISQGEKPPGRELIEASVRKLLLELIELSDTPIDPMLTKPTPKALSEKKRVTSFVLDDCLESDEMPKRRFVGHDINTPKKVGKDDVKMKKGDWICSQCNFMNFSKNMQCLKCKAKAPERAIDNDNDFEMKKGDWECITCRFVNFASRRSCKICSEPCPKLELNPGEWECPLCNFTNFSKNIQCLKCKTKAPERAIDNDNAVEMKKGDWKCITCWFVNFASRTSCKICSEPRPKRQLNPGEWECPSCDFLNFRRNLVCKKCNHEPPKNLLTEKQYTEQIWKKPLSAP